MSKCRQRNTQCHALSIAAQLVLCSILYSGTVLFAIYGFVTSIGFYLLHFNSIPVVFMNSEPRRAVRALYPLICFGGYAVCRFKNSSMPHILIAGTMNIIEQTIFHIIMKKFLDTNDKDIYRKDRFLQVLFSLTIVVSIIMAALGTLFLTLQSGGDYQMTLLIYTFSHISGNYIGLYSYYVLRNHWRNKPSRAYLIDLVVICAVDIVLNVLKSYSIFRFGAIVMSFPLLAYISIRHTQPWSAIADLCITVITFVCVLLGRGPYLEAGNKADLSTIVSLYIMLLCSACLTSLLSLFMEQRRQTFLAITSLKDDVFLMSGQISHDIRAPISHIMAVCETVATGTASQQDMQEVGLSCQTVSDIMDAWLVMLAALEKSSVTPDNVMSNLTIFEKDLQIVDLDNFVQRIHIYTERAIRDAEKPMTIAINRPDSSSYGELQFNGKLLHHVVINLVSNAVKYSIRGMIEVTVFLIGRTHLKVTVSDEGKGIEQEHLPNLFIRFYRVQGNRSSAAIREGQTSFGVGLHIVKSLVDKMNGTVTVTSEFGRGSTFTVTIPCIVTLPPEQSTICDLEDGITFDTSMLDNLHVLIAEDSPLCARVYSKYLAQCAVVKVVSDGALVVNMLREHQYDILLLDGNLPNKSGQQILLQLYREANYDTAPAIVTISGGSLSTTENWSPLIVQHCPKPFTRQDLLFITLKAVRRKTRSSLLSNTES